MNIVKLIECILDNKKSELPESITNMEYSLSDKILDECNNSEILNLTVPFIIARYNKNIGFYCDFVECIDSKLTLDNYRDSNKYCRFVKLKKMASAQMFTRDDKIQINYQKAEFLKRSREFEDREWIFDLLQYFYILAIEEISFLNTVEKMKKEFLNDEHKNIDNSSLSRQKPVWAVEICNENLRKKLLVETNKPTFSLDEYADMLIEQMNLQKKNISSVKKQIDLDEMGEENFKEMTLEELRKRDDFNDSGEKNSGNTIGMG